MEENAMEVHSKVAEPGEVEVAFPPLKHRDDIDGLRALAVLPVVLYHFDLGIVGGFAGVDVFFVISGFLICSIILSKLERGSFSMLEFWKRRCRRLFPALAVMLTFVLFAGNFVLLGDTYTSLLRQGWATLLFSANVRFFLTDPYFFSGVEVPLLHCWSLAVEEQYYLLLPLLLSALWAHMDKLGPPQRVALSTLLLIAGGSFALSVATSAGSPNFAFYLLPTRAWELCIGGLLCFERSGVFSDRRAAEAGSWLGIVLLLLSFLFVDADRAWPGYAAALPCIGGALFIASQREHRSTAGRCLAHPAVVYVGKVSYSLYLWHWPIYVLLVQQSSSSSSDNRLSTLETCGGLLASAVASVFSYHLVEQTTRAATAVPDRRFYPVAGVVYASLLIFCVVGAAAGIGGIRADAPVSSIRDLTAVRFRDHPQRPSETCMVFRSMEQIDEAYSVSHIQIGERSTLQYTGCHRVHTTESNTSPPAPPPLSFACSPSLCRWTLRRSPSQIFFSRAAGKPARLTTPPTGIDRMWSGSRSRRVARPTLQCSAHRTVRCTALCCGS